MDGVASQCIYAQLKCVRKYVSFTFINENRGESKYFDPSDRAR